MKSEINKKILNYCKNFSKIVNTDFLEDDNISIELVKIYQDYIFNIDLNNDIEIDNAIEIDKIMGKYVEDYNFRKTLKQELRTIKIKNNTRNIVSLIVESIISIFRKYELELTRKIYISRWI